MKQKKSTQVGTAAQLPRAARPKAARPVAAVEASPQPRPRTRLPPHEREEQIVEGAIQFFSEVGFGGQTRELAHRLGITQGLLYRYFPEKQQLLERVYKDVFEGRWRLHWEEQLQQRDMSLRSRLLRFYDEYARVIHTSDWVRTYLFAGLAGLDINKRYRALLRKRIFPLVIDEVRLACGLARLDEGRLSDEEDELMMVLHGMVFYEGIRKFVYRIDTPRDPRLKLEMQIEMFLAGARRLYGRPIEGQ